MNRIIASAFATLALSTAAFAGDLAPGAAQSVSLGSVSGTAYYVRESEGLRVVATLSRTGETSPIRFESVLADGQKVRLSAPRAPGAQPYAVEIARIGDAVSVTRAIETVEVAAAGE